MTIAAAIAVYALSIFLGLLLFRLVMTYVMLFARGFHPTGAVAAVLEVAFSVTDPPLKALNRVIPPLRLGRFALDLGFIVVFFACSILLSVVEPYA